MSQAKAPRPIYEYMNSIFRSRFKPTHMEVEDDSPSHAGHDAMKGSEWKETHFRVLIVSNAFKGCLPLQRHRMVYELVQEQIDHGGLHALNISCKTPEEYGTAPPAKED